MPILYTDYNTTKHTYTVSRRSDVLGVHKAVKWNSPFYGTEPGSWFLSYHCFDRYVKVTLFRGTSLDPVPPESSKTPKTRYFHVPESGEFDEEQFSDWVKQASELPGEKM